MEIKNMVRARYSIILSSILKPKVKRFKVGQGRIYRFYESIRYRKKNQAIKKKMGL